MGRSRKQLWGLGAALLAMAFTGFAQNVEPPVSIVIRAPQNIKVGSTVKLDITMTNVSNRVVEGHFESAIRGELNYDIEVRDSKGKSAPETCYMKAVDGLDRGTCPDFILRTHKGIGEDSLKPGEAIKGSADLNELFDLQPGTYTIQASWFEKRPNYRASKKPGHPTGVVVAESNVVTVTIIP